MSPQAEDSQVRVVLLDIEGTTTPVDFVYRTLFPYASSKVDSFLVEHSPDPEVQSLVAELHAQQQRDASAQLHPPPWNEETIESQLHSGIVYARWLMSRDSKCAPLKTLQGKIWEQGYASGELHGEVYADVPPAFARWSRQGREICIYSSGSVLAQQLLFRTTSAGDLTRHISSYFDTRAGAKTETGSYRRIAEMLGRAAGEVLFVSDAMKEIEAARIAGMQALLCSRDVEPEQAVTHSGMIKTFDQIFPG